MAKVILYEDIMHVSEVDPDGKRFDKGAAPTLHCQQPRRQHSRVLLLARWARSVAPAVPRRQLGDGHVAGRERGHLPAEGARCAAHAHATAQLTRAATGAGAQATDKFAFALSATLSEDGTPDDGTFDQVRAQRRVAAPARRILTPAARPQSQNKKSLMDKFEYVMHGACRPSALRALALR